MNRKERRSAGKSGKSGGRPSSNAISTDFTDRLLALADQHARAGDTAQAETLYRNILDLNPAHVVGLYRLGHLALQSGRSEAAADLFGRALAVNDRVPELHYAMAAACHAAGRLPEAGAHCERAAALKPDFAEAWFGHGNVLAAQEQWAEAASRFRRAVALRPDYVEALTNLGNVLHKLGETDDAMAQWRHAITSGPRYPVPHLNLGAACAERSRFDEAIAHYRHALALQPDYPEAAGNLAKAYVATGDVMQALETVRRVPPDRQTDESKATFVYCLRHIRFTAADPELRGLVLHALSEPWERPHLLSGPAAEIAKLAPDLADCTGRVAAAWPRRLSGSELWTAAQRAAVCGDLLLRALMECAPVCDLALERFLVNARLALLEHAQAPSSEIEPAVFEFYCSLARQCFINEYIYPVGGEELAAAERLRQSLVDALGSQGDVPPLWLAAVAAYWPLHSLPDARATLARDWPPALKNLLVQQVDEPSQEAQIRATIPALTPIDDTVSLAVKEQYEVNPYPRWIEQPRRGAADTIESYLRGLFPSTDFGSAPHRDGCDVLVAGCGTGQHAIGTALRYKGARVLAIDLSLTSLAYAKRKTGELGVAAIDYAQADIVRADSIGRTFDVIEAVGVLHHLADPMEGWRKLVALVRPGGAMYLGLYSEIARTSVVAVRAFIAERGYGRTVDDIRRLRQELMAGNPGLNVDDLLTSPDFFSTSGCRDLVFHAQEHRLTIPQIKSFLHANDLVFLGFQLDMDVLQRFRQRFPDAPLNDLDLWHVFETENPQTFAKMYHFWIQKPC